MSLASSGTLPAGQTSTTSGWSAAAASGARPRQPTRDRTDAARVMSLATLEGVRQLVEHLAGPRPLDAADQQGLEAFTALHRLHVVAQHVVDHAALAVVRHPHHRL